ncbi:transcription termination factor NusA [Beggiatoa alba B18LD]|uniref:Transcription termination/antitermination protein NusA n=1 Tax=Beggiatoa alba B18LD TaxID=395493 RepID=I3CJY6_9GAMM|nr:transcription termination factor NusA [Beggiatoa alba]EIJ43929.1 transcription termination factor NusA [Beggiatoa alba B18LD]
MNKEILQVVEVVSNEKGVSKNTIFEALECALASATKKRYSNEIDVRVTINRQTGDYQTVRRWIVVESEIQRPEQQAKQISFADAQKKDNQLTIGDYWEEQIESVNFDRIGAQTAKQVIVQKIREAERALIIDAYASRQGEIISGIVKRIEKGNIIVDVGSNTEAMIPRDELIPREAVRTNDRIRGFLKSVRFEQRGPQLFLNRTSPDFLKALFTVEVPEIGEGLIEIISAARDPGLRAKIAVRSKDARLDPVGACIGMRRSRVQAVMNELCGEKIDIILWDENPAQFVINAMSPAEVVSIILDEDAHSMDVAVKEEQLSQAIGKGGQNVKLASQLTGWTLNVMTESQAEQKNEAEMQVLRNMFVQKLDIEGEIADILVREGFSSLEEVAYVPLSEMLEIEEFDEDLVKELRNRAKDALVTNAIAEEETLSDAQPAEDLANMEGMDSELAKRLASHGIISMDDLAEQSVDDLMSVSGVDKARASTLIMQARAPWFEQEKQ